MILRVSLFRSTGFRIGLSRVSRGSIFARNGRRGPQLVLPGYLIVGLGGSRASKCFNIGIFADG